MLPLSVSRDSRGSSRCGNAEMHGCMVPQIPLGMLSNEMKSLNRELADRVSSYRSSRASATDEALHSIP
jgi:hypothetical protein